MDVPRSAEEPDSTASEPLLSVADSPALDRAARILSFALIAVVLLIGLGGVLVFGAGWVDQDLLSRVLSSLLQCH